MTIPTDNLHDRDVRALASRAVRDAQHTAKEALEFAHGSKEDLFAADAQIDRMVYQDKSVRSWRVWGAFWTFVAGVLAVPEVQTAITAAVGATVPITYAPIVPAVLGTVWPLVSKYRDLRPTKE
jgi:hypothetical protein